MIELTHPTNPTQLIQLVSQVLYALMMVYMGCMCGAYINRYKEDHFYATLPMGGLLFITERALRFVYLSLFRPLMNYGLKDGIGDRTKSPHWWDWSRVAASTLIGSPFQIPFYFAGIFSALL